MTTEPAPIRRRKLSDDVQERVLALIRSKALRPGDVLPSERELMGSYGVGRPAVREAMQNLQRMGLVDIRHGERPRVAQPSMEAMVGNMAEFGAPRADPFGGDAAPPARSEDSGSRPRWRAAPRKGASPRILSG